MIGSAIIPRRNKMCGAGSSLFERINNGQPKHIDEYIRFQMCAKLEMVE